MKANGSWLTEKGSRWFDLSAGWAAGPLGYNPALLRRAVRLGAPGLQSPAGSLTAHEKRGLAGRLVHCLGLGDPWHLVSKDRVDGAGLKERTPFSQLESGLPMGPGDLPVLGGAWWAGPFEPQDLAQVAWLKIEFPGVPAGFIPPVYLTRNDPGPEDTIPAHPLLEVHGLLGRGALTAEKVRNRERLIKVLTQAKSKLPGLTTLRGSFLWGLPIPRHLTPTLHPLNRKRVTFGRFTALAHGGMLLIQPSLEEVAEHLGHRLTELATALKA